MLSAPTIWVYDATPMLYGAHFMLGCAYTLLYGGHIRTAMVWEKFSVPKKGLIDAIAYVAFFFLAMIFFFIACVDDAWHAWELGELSDQTAWRPVLWPFKAVVPNWVSGSIRTKTYDPTSRNELLGGEILRRGCAS